MMATGRIRLLVMSFVMGALLVIGAQSAFASEVAVIDLIDDGAVFDGEVITVVGELIGDYGNRRSGVTWTQLNQDRYVIEPIAEGGKPVGANIGIGVQVPSELLVGADRPGRYRQVGPIVSLTGVWKYHDPDRQGESYLAVTTLDTVRSGESLSEPPDWLAAGVGVGLLIIGLGLLAMRRRRQHPA